MIKFNKSKKMNNETYKWNVNLSWELFSSSVYSYRKALESTREHQRHMYYKSGLLSAVSSVEAYINEILRTEYGWSNTKFKNNQNINKKLEELKIDKSIYKDSKDIRNDFIIHHKEKDHTYFDKINHDTLLNAIESAQEIICLINYNKKRIFPYWITGINFINPSSNGDITLMNNPEFWRHLKYSGFSSLEIYDVAGDLEYKIKDYLHYRSLYFELWEIIKKENFKFQFFSDKIYRKRPILSCRFWD